jgi:hypothetical protein
VKIFTKILISLGIIVFPVIAGTFINASFDWLYKPGYEFYRFTCILIIAGFIHLPWWIEKA